MTLVNFRKRAAHIYMVLRNLGSTHPERFDKAFFSLTSTQVVEIFEFPDALALVLIPENAESLDIGVMRVDNSGMFYTGLSWRGDVERVAVEFFGCWILAGVDPKTVYDPDFWYWYRTGRVPYSTFEFPNTRVQMLAQHISDVKAQLKGFEHE